MSVRGLADLSVARVESSPPDASLSRRDLEIPAHGESVWERRVEAALDALVELPFDWDLNAGGPAESVAAIRALVILRQLLDDSSPAPSVAPLSSGGVALAWYGASLDVEIDVEVDAPQATLHVEDHEAGISIDCPLSAENLRQWDAVSSRLGR
jgi:hypothetical protein